MKYSISILFLASCTMHAGSSLSSQKQPIPLQYIHITPTISDSNSMAVLYTGKYSYVDFGDSLTPAERPSQPHYGYMVNIESANLSSTQQFALKTILSLIYSIQKKDGANIQTIQEPKAATFNLLDQNYSIVEKAFLDASGTKSYTLKILVERISVFRKQ